MANLRAIKEKVLPFEADIFGEKIKGQVLASGMTGGRLDDLVENGGRSDAEAKETEALNGRLQNWLTGLKVKGEIPEELGDLNPIDVSLASARRSMGQTQHLANCITIAELVTEWDLEGDDGKPLPLEAEVLYRELPVKVSTLILTALMEAQSPSKKTSAPSDGSFGAGES